jgi:hypothetical protein
MVPYTDTCNLVNFLPVSSCPCQCCVVSSVHVGASYEVFATYE